MTAVSEAYCAYCGLPVAMPIGAAAPGDEADYCCSGCRVSSAIDQAPAAGDAARRLLVRIGLAIFFTMNVVVFTMELWSQDVYADASYESEFAVQLRGLFQWASLLFAAPVLFLLGGPLVASVRQSLQRRAATTDLLILLGVIASYLYSAISVVRGAGQLYFEVGCVVLVFISLGRWLESRGKQRTGAALDALARLLPEQVRRAVACDSLPTPETATELVPRAEVQKGDVVRVLPGERAPVDGRVIAGRATLDEHVATGESRPVVKGVGDSVYSGALNFDGDLWLSVTAGAGEDLVSRLLKLIRDARRTKGRHERMADHVAAWFTPAVCVFALAAGVWHGWQAGADRGILVGLAVVLIACPCAVGLATPMAVWAALGRAADRQVMFRSGAVLERLAHVRVVCFDKTGTLTNGTPQLRDQFVTPGTDRGMALRVASTLAGGSTHSFSQAIVRFEADAARDTSTSIPAELRIAELKTQAGRGVAGINDCGDVIALLGSSRWMIESSQVMPADLTDALAAHEAVEAPLTFVAWDGMVRGAFVFSEQLRDEARHAIASCHAQKLRTVVLTGDRRSRANAVARELGVEVLADQLPEDKVASLRLFGGSVAMVGDGLNDAPALAAADVGIALGCGADLSREAAGVCLLSDRLDRLPWAIALARQTVRVVRQNLFWAFAYNGLGILLAAAGRLNPIWAAAAMGISSVIVIANSLRLTRFADGLEGVNAEAVTPMEAAPTSGPLAERPPATANDAGAPSAVRGDGESARGRFAGALP